MTNPLPKFQNYQSLVAHVPIVSPSFETHCFSSAWPTSLPVFLCIAEPTAHQDPRRSVPEEVKSLSMCITLGM